MLAIDRSGVDRIIALALKYDVGASLSYLSNAFS